MIRRQDGSIQDRGTMQLQKQAALCRRLAQGAVSLPLMRELSALAEEFERDAHGVASRPTLPQPTVQRRRAAG